MLMLITMFITWHQLASSVMILFMYVIEILARHVVNFIDEIVYNYKQQPRKACVDNNIDIHTLITGIYISLLIFTKTVLNKNKP